MLSSIKVLIAEDSKITAEMLNNILSSHYRRDVVGIVNNGIDAYRNIISTKPDFLVMEIDLPLMGGIELLKLLKKENISINILVMTSFSKNNDLSARALDLGALDIIYKPKNISDDFFKEAILNRIIEITKSKLSNLELDFDLNYNIEVPSNNSKEIIYVSKDPNISKFDDNVKILPFDQKGVATAISKVSKLGFEAPKLVAIGISTGGPRALRIMLPSLPKDFPSPILISQHIPKDFSSSLISSLSDICKIEIKEAVSDEEILPSVVYISPGDKNMGIYSDSSGKIKIRLYTDYENKFIYTPSVDYLFDTINDTLVNKSIAIVMTGMGNDGTEGMIKLYNNKNLTIAQSKETCTVYGMPRSVIENQTVHLVMSLYDIAEFLVQYVRSRNK